MKIFRILPFALLLASTGCGPGRPTDEEFLKEARRLSAEMGKTLLAEVKGAMQEGGPVHAIEVCATRAREIAARFSTGGFRIRRIGTRIRNKEHDTPTPREAALLAKIDADTAEVFEKLDGERVYLRAIRIGSATCLLCHGKEEGIAPAVREALKRRYPEDEALGYALGDLRGAFVVREASPSR